MNTQENIYNILKNIVSKSQSDNICILGKGPSIQNIDLDLFLKEKNPIIITINDAECFVQQADICFAPFDWIESKLETTRFRSKYYFSGFEFQNIKEKEKNLVLPSIPDELTDNDFILKRFESIEIFNEQFALINALKFSYLFSQLKNRKQNVYLFGFDFSTVSEAWKSDASGLTLDERNAFILSQKTIYEQIKRYCQHSLIIQRNLQDKKKKINFENPDKVLIVAEFTNNHYGELSTLLEMVERAKEAGADLVKIQKRDVDTFYSSEQLNGTYISPFGSTLRDYRKGVELNNDMLLKFIEKCEECDIEWFCSILDFKSFLEIQKFNPSIFKIPSTISNHRNYHKQLAETYEGPLVISTGYTDWKYVDYIQKTFLNSSIIYLLHCVSAYPTQQKDCNISVIHKYRNLGKQFVPGYSSHDIGSIGSMLAVAAGAKMIEKHVKLKDTKWIHFDSVALNLKNGEFTNFVSDIRTAEKITGSDEKKILKCEHHKYLVNH
jgi:sialic acid synthase SpsE